MWRNASQQWYKSSPNIRNTQNHHKICDITNYEIMYEYIFTLCEMWAWCRMTNNGTKSPIEENCHDLENNRLPVKPITYVFLILLSFSYLNCWCWCWCWCWVRFCSFRLFTISFLPIKRNTYALTFNYVSLGLHSTAKESLVGYT